VSVPSIHGPQGFPPTYSQSGGGGSQAIQQSARIERLFGSEVSGLNGVEGSGRVSFDSGSTGSAVKRSCYKVLVLNKEIKRKVKKIF
jgi:hypothetical protein